MGGQLKYLDNLDFFAMDGSENIREEEHLGIVNGLATAGVPFKSVLSVKGLFAPPYASSNFFLEMRMFGEKVPTETYQWNFFEIHRQGRIKDVAVSSVFMLISGMRAAISAVTIKNSGAKRKTIPLQLNLTGDLDYIRFWEFAVPKSCRPTATISKAGGGGIFVWTYPLDKYLDAGKKVIKANDAGVIVVGTDFKGDLRWEDGSSCWEGTISLVPEEQQTFHVILTIGDHKKANDECNRILNSPKKIMKESHQEWSRKINNLFTKLPKLEAQDPRLEQFYNRSLLHFLMNRWEIPEFLLQPFYSTGGVNGGCLCSYLWDFGEPWEIFPLYDPDASRSHIKQFLKCDITSHFSFSPITGEAFGPFYPVNQEKIIFLIYYHVLHTGDLQFLNEKFGGKTILDWAIYHATWGDNLNKPVALLDYGSGNHHLELRGKYRYDHYLPDLNGRRYNNYKAVDYLCKLARKKTGENFSRRAEDLKMLIKNNLWDKKAKWFFYLDERMNKHLRYTIQMYKLIGSGVLDKEEEEGLLSHLNEKEFLSDYGLHSMSKLDIAYDQEDIDNGGGGNYVSFPPQIIERLYKAGHFKSAEDILRRILWWGQKLPYWGDSMVANKIDYRKDTPLQSCIGALAGAQCIIFGMFGVKVNFDGSITINPTPPSFSPEIKLKGLKIQGFDIDIHVKKTEYLLKVDRQQIIRSKIGTPVLIHPKAKKRF